MMKKYALFLLLVMIFSSLLSIVPSNADEVLYYGYTSSGTSYTLYPGPFNPYWETTYKGRTTKVTTAEITISTQGFPSEFSTDLIVDGKTMGSLAGGGTAKFQIKGDDVHTFQVSSYVSGKGGERFYCKGNSWTSEKGNEVEVEKYRQAYIPYYWWWDYPYSWYYYYPYYQKETETIIEPFDQGYTFRYEAEYELTVQNEFGGGVSQTGWYPRDSMVTLSTKPLIETSQDTRHVFEAWTINDADVSNEQVSLKMDKPYSAVASYKKQYYLEVRSDYGNPYGSGWYDEGSKATIQVEKILPVEGFWGTLGAKRVFDYWSGGIASQNNIVEVTVDSPKLIIANWRIDNSVPNMIILILIVVIAVIIIFALLRHPLRRVLTRERKIETGRMTPLEILKVRYAKGEISKSEYNRMKKDLELEDKD